MGNANLFAIFPSFQLQSVEQRNNQQSTMEEMECEPDDKRLELTELIDTILNRMGRFQRVIILLLCAVNGIVGINHTVTSLHTFTHPFQCVDAEGNRNDGCSSNELRNNTSESLCIDFRFDHEPNEKTIVMEWMLICSRKYLAPLLNTLYYTGVAFGAMICGKLSDHYGRKLVVLICLHLQFIAGILLYFAGTYEAFTSLRVLQGFFVQGLQGASYTLISELCAPKYRMASTTAFALSWSVGLAFLGTSAYFFTNWRHLQLMIMLPSLIVMSYMFLVPESPTWLVTMRQYERARKAITGIAEKDGNVPVAMPADVIKDSFVAIASTEVRKRSNTIVEPVKGHISDLFKNYILRKHLIVMMMVWFSGGLSYYGILFFIPNLIGNRNINFIFGAVIEAATYCSAYFLIMKFGNRVLVSSYQIGNAIACFSIAIISYFATAKDWNGSMVIVALCIIAKIYATLCYSGMMNYAVQLFPTIHRGAAFGLCSLTCRIGTLIAPQLMSLVAFRGAFLPMSVIGVCLFVSGSSVCFLPESHGSPAPNTLEDVELLWGKESKSRNKGKRKQQIN